MTAPGTAPHQARPGQTGDPAAQEPAGEPELFERAGALGQPGPADRTLRHERPAATGRQDPAEHAEHAESAGHPEHGESAERGGQAGQVAGESAGRTEKEERPGRSGPAEDRGRAAQPGPAGHREHAEVPGQAGSAAEQTLLMPRVHRPADALAERPGPCLPGWTAGIVLPAALAAAGWLLWRAALLPLGGLFPDPPGDAERGSGLWSGLVLIGAVAALAACGLVRGRPGSVWVLTRHGAYRGTVRRTGLLWISPLLRRRRTDVSLRHWRSRPIDAVDAHGTPVQLTVLLVWRIRETARAAFAVDDCTRLLREEVEAAVARAVSRHPADDFGGNAVTLRDCDRLGDELGHLVSAAMREVGVEVFSVTPVRLDYAPDVAAAMRRARIASLEARQRRAMLDDVLTAVADTLRGITERGLVELDDYERKSLVRDLTVALLATPESAGRTRG